VIARIAKIAYNNIFMNKPSLTIGMATFDDFHGVYFSVQALRMYHPEIMNETEILIIDNNPSGVHGKECRSLSNHSPNIKYYAEPSPVSTAIRNKIFERAKGDFVVSMDCHILFEPGSLKKLLEIPMQGLGIFSCRKEAWLGFNAMFRGFGGEEGYIHEKFRQNGRKCWCLPFLRWVHRFGRPDGVKYPLTIDNKLRNYFIGHHELGLDVAPVIDHFSKWKKPDLLRTMSNSVRIQMETLDI
jgi:hypothetical protein